MKRLWWGTFPHSESGVPTGRGFVARPCSPEGIAEDAHNYGGLAAHTVHRSQKSADRRADKLSGRE